MKPKDLMQRDDKLASSLSRQSRSWLSDNENAMESLRNSILINLPRQRTTKNSYESSFSYL